MRKFITKFFIISSSVFFVACSDDGDSSKIKVEVITENPVVIFSQYPRNTFVDADTGFVTELVPGPWFNFRATVTNESDKVVVILVFRSEFTSFQGTSEQTAFAYRPFVGASGIPIACSDPAAPDPSCARIGDPANGVASQLFLQPGQSFTINLDYFSIASFNEGESESDLRGTSFNVSSFLEGYFLENFGQPDEKASGSLFVPVFYTAF